jgi:hypothetical protein
MAEPVAAPTLDDLGRELAIQKMKNAMLEVKIAFPDLSDKLLSFYQGPPEGLTEYAKGIHDELASRTPPAPASPPPTPAPVPAPTAVATPPSPAANPPVAVPAPAPGPGAGVTPDTDRAMRLRDFRAQVIDKQLNVHGYRSGRNEAEEYFGLALGDGLRRSGIVKERPR